MDEAQVAEGSVDLWVDRPGGRLAVYLGGEGPETVFLLHGGPGVPDYLEPVGRLLAPHVAVVRYDQRGTGRSADGFRDFDLESQTEDLEAIRRALGCDRIGLFGHSWGGTLAQLYATKYPERVGSMFLCNSGIGLGSDWKEMERAVMSHNRVRGGLGGFLQLGVYQMWSMLPVVSDSGARRLMSLVWRNYFEPPSSAPAPEPDWLTGVRSAPIFGTRGAAVGAAADRLNPQSLPDDLEVLVLFGSKDIYGPTTRILLDRYPGARHVTLEGCGHVPWLQDPSGFEAELVRFYRDGSAGPRRGA